MWCGRDTRYGVLLEELEELESLRAFDVAKASADDQLKHQDFLQRMITHGYTKKQVRLLSEWYLRVRKSQ